MKNGMVLSNVYSLIKHESEEDDGIENDSNYWKNFIATNKSDYRVNLTSNVPTDPITMTELETKIIDDIWKEYGSKDQFEMVKILHNKILFPEWTDPHPYGVHEVSIYELLSHMKKSPEETSIILDKIETM